MQRVLWITGRLPYPLRSGDALYSAGLLRAAHSANLKVTVIGLPRASDVSADQLKSVAAVDWHPVRAQPRSFWKSLLSALPKDAYSLYPSEFHDQLSEMLKQEWEWIVFDHARSGGGLDLVTARNGSKIAYVAHNVERKVRPKVAAEMAGSAFRAPYVVDAEKYTKLENRLVRAAHAIIAITNEDADEFRQAAAVAHHVPPVFLGPKIAKRLLDSSTPRRVMLLGSFDWVAKQKNLVRFLESVGPRLTGAGIGIDIIGLIPQELRRKVRRDYPAVQLLGPVEDVCAIANQARCGVIPEELGGGMKLKTLDYIFMRLPVFSLDSGVAGLPPDARNSVFSAANFQELGDAIVNHIDDLQELNWRQMQAFEVCENRFSVEEAALALKDAFGTVGLSLAADAAGC